MKAIILISVLALAVAKIVPEKQTCLEEPETGMCRAYIPMFHYDYKSKSCKKFIYGGCGGNGNRYLTEEDCLGQCGAFVVSESDSDVCDLPKEAGLCFAAFRRFYFDKSTGECKRFIYGGCGGNGNRFNTIEECQERCGVQAGIPDRDICDFEKEVGPCRGSFKRYFFNKDSKECEEFTYGGCMGNINNFSTMDECNAICPG